MRNGEFLLTTLQASNPIEFRTKITAILSSTQICTLKNTKKIPYRRYGGKTNFAHIGALMQLHPDCDVTTLRSEQVFKSNNSATGRRIKKNRTTRLVVRYLDLISRKTFPSYIFHYGRNCDARRGILRKL